MNQTDDSIDFHCQNAAYVESLLRDYLRDESSVPPAWRVYFAALAGPNGVGHRDGLRPSFQDTSLFHPPAARSSAQRAGTAARPGLPDDADAFSERIARLVRAYRVRGHLVAKLDPLGSARPELSELDPSTYGLSERDLDRVVATTTVGGPNRQTLRDLIGRLRHTYCRYIGAQFMHIDDLETRDWLQQRMEQSENRLELPRETQLRILTRLTDAVVFEEFVRKKYIGAKTFSLEGSESLLPLLHLAIDKAADQGIDEIVIGMAHRGRLSVLANIIGKSLHEIFREFEDPDPERYRGRGDVKYHLGFSGDWRSPAGRSVHLSLCFNPSHLEFVNPVALGRMRAKQDRSGDTERRHGMVLLIHGDAAFAGEGIVQESLNLSQLGGYRVGGTLHVIVNNQIGFTTRPHEARSTMYPSDVARMLQVPILHVNGEHPEAVAQVIDLAMNFRHKFQRDVIIDMYSYRRWGHNETDEPSFTQPLLYHAIEQRPSVRDAYLEHLLELGGITTAEADQVAAARHEAMQAEFQRVKAEQHAPPTPAPAGVWTGYLGGPEPADDDPDTGVPVEQLRKWLARITEVPDSFHRHPKLQRSVEQRLEMADGKRPLDWSAAEALALATLALEGHPVRLSGQDAERGTFSQRHAVLRDCENGQRYEILNHLVAEPQRAAQARVEIINSPLNESGVLGFDYGYSLDYPEALVAWEAQFGDFCNAAQVIIDQFIASAEDKWNRLSGLVLLLPHGFEGAGPEHSSARPERFLSLAAEDNIQVAYPSTPAQYFHLLRRQVKRRWRKPLVVLTPKSLLRHRQAVSSLEELAQGRFRRILPDSRKPKSKTSRLLLCCGKLYYELIAAREKRQRSDLAIVRVEQFYPLVDEVLESLMQPYTDRTSATWVQEEPENMGAWPYWRYRFGHRLLDRFPLSVVARPASASPATGSHGSHNREQQELIDRAFEE